MQRRAFAILVAMLVAATYCGNGWTRGGHGNSGGGGHGHSGSGGHTRSGSGGHPHRPHVGVFVGGAVFGTGYYWPPAYYYPPGFMDPYGTPEYIEQGGAAPASPKFLGYWYYCASSNSYYPYVQQCPEGWQQVAPHLPPG
jgi:hypothetical protein